MSNKCQHTEVALCVALLKTTAGERNRLTPEDKPKRSRGSKRPQLHRVRRVANTLMPALISLFADFGFIAVAAIVVEKDTIWNFSSCFITGVIMATSSMMGAIIYYLWEEIQSNKKVHLK